MMNLKAVSICLLLLTCQTVFGFEQLQEFDRELVEHISGNRFAELDVFVESVSLTSPIIEYGIATGFGVSGYFSDNQDALNFGLVSLSSLLTTQVFCVTLKYAFDRERPNLDKYVYQPRLPLTRTRITPSFPSGHTASSFAFATVFSDEYPDLKILLFGYAVLSGISQVYVGNHYPLDVLAGAILGYGISKIVVNHKNRLIDSVGLENRKKRVKQNVEFTFFRTNW